MRNKWLLWGCGPVLATTLLLTGMGGCGGSTSNSKGDRAVTGPALSSLSIGPSSITLFIGQTHQLTVTATYSDGTTGDLTDAVSWQSSNQAIATVSLQGVATGDAPGTVTLTATSQSDQTKNASARVSVSYQGMFMYHNDLGRTGQNLNETTLSPANVNPTQFAKLVSYPVDGGIYAQPLYVQSVTIPSRGVHNVVYVATEHDSVYAFDADGQTSVPLWQVSFINTAAGITSVPTSQVSDDAFPGGEIGITGTPVIDPIGGTLYVAAYTEENSSFIYRLHALDLATGAEKLGGPVLIQATVPGRGDGNNGLGQVPFSAQMHLQRPGLLLLNGAIYICFGSHDDTPTWHGWMMAYDANTLQQIAVFNTTPNAQSGAIWASGAPPAADSAGAIYFATGNGAFDANSGGSDYGNSVLKLQQKNLSVLDWFTPFNQAQLDDNDVDLGSGGTLLLPDQPGPNPHLLVTVGKEGRIYLINRDNLGHFNPTSDNSAVQELVRALIDINMTTPAYWEGNIYIAGSNDFLKTFRLVKGLLSTQPTARSTSAFGYCGNTPSVSAHGSTSGIVWAVDTGDLTGPAILHAYDAMNVSHELYNSTQAGSRDTLGLANKFPVATAINGKVYVPTATELDVMGLLVK